MERDKIVSEILEFMRAGLTYKKIGKVKQSELDLHPEIKECSFKPKINKKSKDLNVFIFCFIFILFFFHDYIYY